MNTIFFNQRSDLRSGWKFACYVAVFLPLWLALAIALSLAAPPGIEESDLGVMGLNSIAFFIPAVLATLFMARFVDHVPVMTFGVGFHERWAAVFSMGVVIAAGMLLLVLAGAALFGDIDMMWTASEFSFGALAATFAILAVAAASEEMLFRGYPLQTLMTGIGPWPAMLLMSCLFGFVHIQNPNASALGVSNTVLAGVMLSLAYWRTRSLWLPYGIHLAWNVGLGVIAGFPLSGLDIASFWTTRVSGPPEILGGAYGPEGGGLGTLAFVAGTVAVWVTRFRISEFGFRILRKPEIRNPNSEIRNL